MPRPQKDLLEKVTPRSKERLAHGGLNQIPRHRVKAKSELGLGTQQNP